MTDQTAGNPPFLRPDVQVQNGLPSLFYTDVSLPIANAKPMRVNIDTGSVGFVIPNSLLIDPNTNNYYSWAVPTGETMTVIYEPSGVTTSGPIVTVSGLSLAGGTVKLGPVKVLAHTQGSDSFMMGVGFGLQAKCHYGMADAPQPWTSAATALDNPFLHVQGAAPGYFMSAAEFDGTPGLVIFGPTAQQLDGFRFLPLTADAKAPAGFQLPWVTLTATPSGAGTLETKAQLLMDAGIQNMFLSVYQPSPPPAGTTPDHVHVEWVNAAVRIQAADASGAPVLGYAFVNGNPGSVPFHNTDPNQPASPSEILLGGPSPQGGSFINTGGHLLAIYDYVFDAANSRLGLRPR